MRHIKLYLFPLGLTVLWGLCSISCSDNNGVGYTETVEDTTEILRSTQMDRLDNILGDIVIDAYTTYELYETGRNAQSLLLSDCVTVTITAEQNVREISIDFGSEGCIVRGNLLKGHIDITYSRFPDLQEVLINYSLRNFYFNSKSVEATRTILKERANDNGNPMFTHNLDINIIWPNGASASRQGVKIREWVEGAGSVIFSDNVFEVTGNWTTSFVNGNSNSYQILEPLRREVICTYFVSGSVSIERTNFGGVFDYGNGDCDNLATLTYNNGQEISITLD